MYPYSLTKKQLLCLFCWVTETCSLFKSWLKVWKVVVCSILSFLLFRRMRAYSALIFTSGMYMHTGSGIWTNISPQWSTFFPSLVFLCSVQWIRHAEVTGLSPPRLFSICLLVCHPMLDVHEFDDVSKSDRSQSQSSQVLNWNNPVHRNQVREPHQRSWPSAR